MYSLNRFSFGINFNNEGWDANAESLKMLAQKRFFNKLNKLRTIINIHTGDADVVHNLIFNLNFINSLFLLGMFWHENDIRNAAVNEIYWLMADDDLLFAVIFPAFGFSILKTS